MLMNYYFLNKIIMHYLKKKNRILLLEYYTENTYKDISVRYVMTNES